MKKLAILFITLATILSLSNIGFAIGTMSSAEKQMLADGDMASSGTTSWTKAPGITATKIATGGIDGGQWMKLDYTTGGNQTYQPVLTIGKIYTARFCAKGDGTAYPRVYIGNSIYWQGTASTDWQCSTLTGVANGSANFYLTVSATGSAGFDEVYVTEYTGETLNAEKQILVDGDMESAGTANYFQNYVTITKSTTGAYAGTQALNLVSASAAIAPYAYTGNILTVGKTYNVRGAARSVDGVAIPQLSQGVYAALWTGTASTQWQPFNVTFVANSQFVRFYGHISSGIGNNSQWDEIYITEYKGQTLNSEKQLVPDGDMEEKVTYGAELLTNGTLETGNTTGWGTYGGVTISAETTSPYEGSYLLRALRTGGSPFAKQDIFTIYQTYHVTGVARSDGTTQPIILYPTGSLTYAPWIGAISTDWQPFDFYYTAPVNGSFNLYAGGAGGHYTEWDNMSVKRVLSGTSQWTALNYATLYKVQGKYGQALRVEPTNTAGPIAYHANVFTLGKSYRCTGWYRGDGAGVAIPTIDLGFGGSTEPLITGSNSNTWQYFDTGVFTPAISGTLTLRHKQASGYVEFDEIFCNEVN